MEQSINCQENTWLLIMCCNITSKIPRTTISATNRPRVKFKQRGSLYKLYIIRNDKDQNKKYFTKQSFNFFFLSCVRKQGRGGKIVIAYAYYHFRYLKTQPKTIGLSTRLWGINTGFVFLFFLTNSSLNEWNVIGHTIKRFRLFIKGNLGFSGSIGLCINREKQKY